MYNQDKNRDILTGKLAEKMARKEEKFQCSNSGSTLLSNIVAVFVAIGLSLKWVYTVLQHNTNTSE